MRFYRELSCDDGWILLEILVSLVLISVVAITVSRILYQAENSQRLNTHDSFWARTVDPGNQPLPLIDRESDGGGNWERYRWTHPKTGQTRVLTRYVADTTPQ